MGGLPEVLACRVHASRVLGMSWACPGQGVGWKRAGRDIWGAVLKPIKPCQLPL